MLSLYYHEVMGKIKAHERKKYLMIYDYMLHKVLGNIREAIGIEKFDDTKILIDIDDKLRDNITLKNVADINDMRY